MILVAAAAAIIGDNCGYWAARLGAMNVIRRSTRLVLVGGYFVVLYWKKRVGLEGSRA